MRAIVRGDLRFLVNEPTRWPSLSVRGGKASAVPNGRLTPTVERESNAFCIVSTYRSSELNCIV